MSFADVPKCKEDSITTEEYRSLGIQLDQGFYNFTIPLSLSDEAIYSRLFSQAYSDSLWSYSERKEHYQTVLISIATLADYTPDQRKAIYNRFLDNAPLLVKKTNFYGLIKEYIAKDPDLSKTFSKVKGLASTTYDVYDVIKKVIPFAEAYNINEFKQLEIFQGTDIAAYDTTTWQNTHNWFKTIGICAKLLDRAIVASKLSKDGTQIISESVLMKTLANDIALQRLLLIESTLSNSVLMNDPAFKDALNSAKIVITNLQTESVMQIILDKFLDKLGDIVADIAPIIQEWVRDEILKSLQTLTGVHSITTLSIAQVGTTTSIALLTKEFLLIYNIYKQEKNCMLSIVSSSVANELCRIAVNNCQMRVPAMYSYVISSKYLIDAFDWEPIWFWNPGQSTVDNWTINKQQFLSDLAIEVQNQCDSINPSVLGHKQSNSANLEVEIYFSENMDISTLSPNISIVGTATGTHTLTLVFDQTTYTLKITSSTQFQPSETITVSIGAGVKDLAGNPLLSSYTFSFLLPAISIVNPNANAMWQTGTVQQIQWNSQGNVGSLVKVELSRNGGSTWEQFPDDSTTIYNVDGANSLNWSVNGAATTNAKIRVTSISNPSISATSGVFSIFIPCVGHDLKIWDVVASKTLIKPGEINSFDVRVYNAGAATETASINMSVSGASNNCSAQKTGLVFPVGGPSSAIKFDWPANCATSSSSPYSVTFSVMSNAGCDLSIQDNVQTVSVYVTNAPTYSGGYNAFKVRVYRFTAMNQTITVAGTTHTVKFLYKTTRSGQNAYDLIIDGVSYTDNLLSSSYINMMSGQDKSLIYWAHQYNNGTVEGIDLAIGIQEGAYPFLEYGKNVVAGKDTVYSHSSGITYNGQKVYGARAMNGMLSGDQNGINLYFNDPVYGSYSGSGNTFTVSGTEGLSGTYRFGVLSGTPNTSTDVYLAFGRFDIKPPQFAIYVNKIGSGSGQAKINGTNYNLPYQGSFTAGTTVSVEAVPDGISNFDGWASPYTGAAPLNIIGTSSDIIAIFSPKTASISVNITPAEAVTSGARWRVDGGTWHSSGENQSGLSIGTHTIEFNSISGWNSPASLNNVSIAGDQLLVISGAQATYSVKTGSVQVSISPAGAVTAGAQWRVDGGAWQNSGSSVLGLSVLVSHTIEFKTIAGWTAPAAQTVAVSSVATTAATGTYTQLGALSVTTTPISGDIHVDGLYKGNGTWSGYITPGPHTVSFGSVTGFTTPTAQTSAVVAGQTTIITGTYSVTATATITINNGTNPANSYAKGSQTNRNADAFTLNTNSGSCIVTGLVVTGTNTANIAANGVKIYQDSGSSPNIWDATDTLIATGSFSGTTATFTGLNINVGTSSTQYIITYDTVASPTNGQTLTGTLTDITTTCSKTGSDSSGSTITIDTVAPVVSSTTPANNTTGIPLNSTVTINWTEASGIDCNTVNTTNITISPNTGTWARTSCSGNSAVFTPTGQNNSTPYTVTESTGVKDLAGNPMALQYQSYTTVGSCTPSSLSVAINSPSNSFTATKGSPTTVSANVKDNCNSILQQWRSNAHAL